MKRVLALLMTLALVAPSLADAAVTRAAVVLSHAGGVHAEFVDALRALLPADGSIELTAAGSTDGALDGALLDRADIALAVGYPAAEALARRASPPTLAVLVVERSILKLRGQYPNARLSAIVLDQPAERQMSLVRRLLPTATGVGVMLGPQSAPQRSALAAAAKQFGLNAVFTVVDSPDRLLESLDALMPVADLIVATPDPAVTNASTVRSMLLSTYRRGVPVVAYSKAYVDAGALAAVYSSPRDIAREVAEWLARRAGSPDPPFIAAPRYFSVAVNGQVARALGLVVPDQALLAQALAHGGTP